MISRNLLHILQDLNDLGLDCKYLMYKMQQMVAGEVGAVPVAIACSGSGSGAPYSSHYPPTIQKRAATKDHS